MSFKMKCPKCESQSYSVERDLRTYATGKSGELVFSCRCGKQLFGDQLTAEYDRQKALWEADPARQAADAERQQRLRDEEARQEALRQAFEYRKAWVAQKRMGIEQPNLSHPLPPPPPRPQPARPMHTPLEVRRPLDPRLASRPPTSSAQLGARGHEAPRRADTPAAAERSQAGGEAVSMVCEWAGCTNARAPNSKYCSRACSNKNARLRHAKRKKGSQGVAA